MMIFIIATIEHDFLFALQHDFSTIQKSMHVPGSQQIKQEN